MAEPLEVKAYQCPLHTRGCMFLSVDRASTLGHANVPLAKALPNGLIYAKKEIKNNESRRIRVYSYDIVLEQGHFGSFRNTAHTYTQLVASFDQTGKYVEKRHMNSRVFRELLRYGGRNWEDDVSLLTERDFERVKDLLHDPDLSDCSLGREILSIERLIRTTPELEEIFSKRALKPLRIKYQKIQQGEK